MFGRGYLLILTLHLIRYNGRYLVVLLINDGSPFGILEYLLLFDIVLK